MIHKSRLISMFQDQSGYFHQIYKEITMFSSYGTPAINFIRDLSWGSQHFYSKLCGSQPAEATTMKFCMNKW